MMPIKTVKRCIRPQCMKIYEEREKNRFCMCGALLKIIEIDIMPKKNTCKKPVYVSKPGIGSVQKMNEHVVSLWNGEKSKFNQDNQFNDEFDMTTNTLMQASLDVIDEPVNREDEYNINKDAFLYLLLEDEEVEFKLSNITRIGRDTNTVRVDIDLSKYVGKGISREHAIIRKEKDGYYITNVSRNHSVRLLDQDNNEVLLEYDKKALLKTGDGVILSKKILLQFEEEE